MTKANRIWLSISFGWGVKLIPLGIYLLIPSQITGFFAAAANVDFLIGGLLAPTLGGIGFRGYAEDGRAMYEGTPILMPILLLAFFSGFFFYPLIIYLLLALREKYQSKSYSDI